MNYLIIGCHPYNGSFAAGVTKNITDILKSKGETVTLIDLIADGFNPVMDQEDLKLWTEGRYKDSLVGRYKAELQKADVLIFPFPIWWGIMPAVLKGFVDKVFLPGFAYTYGQNGEIIGLMAGKRAVVITTMQTPSAVFKEHYGDPVTGAFIKDTLNTCGITVDKHFVVDRIMSGGRENSEHAMSMIIKYFS